MAALQAARALTLRRANFRGDEAALPSNAPGIGHIAQRYGLGVLFVEKGLSLSTVGERHSRGSQRYQQRTTGDGQLHEDSLGGWWDEEQPLSSDEARGCVLGGECSHDNFLDPTLLAIRYEFISDQ